MNHETLNLKEYRCKKCGRVFYIKSDKRSSLDIDFGCPFACDDAGMHTRNIVTEIKEETNRCVNDFQMIKDYEVRLSFLPGEFELSMGRSPQDQDEFDAWAALVEKGLLNGHIDWDILYQCACEALEDAGDEE